MNSGKKIVFLIQNFSRPAGSERVTSLLANSLCDSGYDISIISICGDNTSFYSINPNIKLYTLINLSEVDNKRYFFKVLFCLKKLFKSIRPNLVINVFSSLAIYTLLLKKKFKYKTISWEHFNFKAKVGLNTIGRKMAARKSDYIVTLTNSDKNYYLSAFPKMRSKIEYIYNPSPYETKPIDFTKKENSIIAVGRLTYQKGYDYLVEVWKIVEKYIDWNLYIYGQGEEKDNLLKQISMYNLKNIHILNPTNQIDKVYEKASLFLSTSRFEGLPMTMIEAQCFGIPIISFDYDTGPKDIIINNHNGIIISGEDNINKMANAIIDLVSDKEKLILYSENALQDSQRFDKNIIMEKWYEILGELL